MPNGIFTGSITQGRDGSLSFELQSLRVKAAKRFTPAQLLPLQAWLKTAATEWELVPERQRGLRVTYSHDDGRICLDTPGGSKYYDPTNDEDIARFVRYLKSRAPIPRSEQPELPGLPEVTEEDLRTKRSIYAEAQAAGGVKKPRRKKKPVPVADPEAEARLDAIMNQMLLGV